MLLFRDRVVGRRVLLLAAPLLVCGTLLWQRQSSNVSVNRTSANSYFAQNGRPPGISAEEWGAACVELEALADSTFRCDVQEMPAYWRLLKWSLGMSEDERDTNSFSLVSFNHLVNSPSELRGAAVQVDLHVRRIVEYPAPANSLGIERLFEVWGWSDDSRGSLFVAVTPELPAGMPIGESVSERATVRGYFYKIQGYLAAGSAAQSSPSTAPLIIGRMSRWQEPVAALASTNELWFGSAGLLLAASFIWLLSQRPFFRVRYREQMAPNATARLESWLDSSPTGPELA